MAKNLWNAGYLSCVWNRTEAKAEEFRRMGVTVASSPHKLASSVNVVFTMLSNPDAVRAVAEGNDGILSFPTPSIVWVDMSTVSPEFSREMAKKSREKGLEFVDAPVLGSIKPAEEGALIIFAAGRQETVESLCPLFSCLGKHIFYLGENGMGSAMKLTMNLMLGVFLAGASEALHLAESLGMPEEILSEVCQVAPILSPSLQQKIPRMLSGTITSTFLLQHMVKDLKLILKTAENTGIQLPLTQQAFQHFSSAEQMGLGQKDYSAVWDFVKTLKR